MAFAFCPIYTGDYRKKTATLSPREHGIYLLLLFHQWDEGGGEITADLDRLARATSATSEEDVQALRFIVDKYFERSEDGKTLRQKRLAEEHVRAGVLSGVRSKAGKLGAAARKRLGKQMANREAKAQQNGSKTTAEVATSHSHPHSHSEEPTQSQKRSQAAAPLGEHPPDKLPPGPQTWESFAAAYLHRYSTAPPRNALTNAACSRLVALIGEGDAPAVAAYFVGMQDARYVACSHDLKALVHDAQKVHTAWKTGRSATPIGTRDTNMGRRRDTLAGLTGDNDDGRTFDGEAEAAD